VDAQKLVKMANSIAAFFEGEPDRQAAVAGVAGHIARFWDPRMRRAIIAFVDDQGGTGLKETALEAIQTHRAKLLPKSSP
jgi:formate dehydrogenase subunit delta